MKNDELPDGFPPCPYCQQVGCAHLVAADWTVTGPDGRTDIWDGRELESVIDNGTWLSPAFQQFGKGDDWTHERWWPGELESDLELARGITVPWKTVYFGASAEGGNPIDDYLPDPLDGQALFALQPEELLGALLQQA
jgi:hypothetical protein